MLLQKSILVPFTTTRTLKILHIRKSGVDMEGPARTSRGNLFENWDMGSDTDSMADEDLGADPDPDVMTAYDVHQKTGHPTKARQMVGSL